MTDETIARTSNSNRSSNDPSAGSAERVRTERTGAAGDTEAAGPQVGAGAVRTSKTRVCCEQTALRIEGKLDQLRDENVRLRAALTSIKSMAAGARQTMIASDILQTARKALAGAAPETGASPFDRAAILADPRERRISMSFETQEQYEAALVFLDMADTALKANERAPEVCGCPYGQCNCNDGSENEKP